MASDDDQNFFDVNRVFLFFILWRVAEPERFDNCFAKFGTMED